MVARGVKADPRGKPCKKVATKKATGVQLQAVLTAFAKKSIVGDAACAENAVAQNQLVASLDNIVRLLIAEPEKKIFIIEKMCNKEELFKRPEQRNKEMLHRTIIYVRTSPKGLWRAALVAYSEWYATARKGGKVWTDDLLCTMDVTMGLKGVETLLVALADLEMNDLMPTRSRSQFVSFLFERMKQKHRPLPHIKHDGTLDLKDCLAYRLGQAEGPQDRITQIIHFSGAVCTIPSDMFVTSAWKITGNHSTVYAELVGARNRENVWKLFEEDHSNRRDAGEALKEWAWGRNREAEFKEIIENLPSTAAIPVPQPAEDEPMEPDEPPPALDLPPPPPGTGEPDVKPELA